MVLAGLLEASDAYKAIDWSVVVLLAAMIPVGQALETTGGADLIARQILAIGEGQAPWLVLSIILIGTMLLSNVVNNAAAAILVAPIALGVAGQLGLSSDATLMAVAIGASCAFLTPIGHQSNGAGHGTRGLPVRRLLAPGVATVCGGHRHGGAGYSLGMGMTGAQASGSPSRPLKTVSTSIGATSASGRRSGLASQSKNSPSIWVCTR